MTDNADHRFIEHLQVLRERGDRGALASLRRALGKEPGAAPKAYPIVMPYVAEHAGERVERIYFLVGSLFALRPKSWACVEGERSARDFGASMRILAERRPGGVERRFGALLACGESELAEHMRHAVALLKSEEVPIYWLNLLSDLRQWNYERRPAQRRWARSFWAGSMTGSEGAGATGNNEE